MTLEVCGKSLSMDLDFGFFGEGDNVPSEDLPKLQGIIQRTRQQDSNSSVTFLFDDERVANWTKSSDAGTHVDSCIDSLLSVDKCNNETRVSSESIDRLDKGDARILATIKPTERRNKKRRPRDYYSRAGTNPDGSELLTSPDSNSQEGESSRTSSPSEQCDVTSAEHSVVVNGYDGLPDDPRKRESADVTAVLAPDSGDTASSGQEVPTGAPEHDHLAAPAVQIQTAGQVRPSSDAAHAQSPPAPVSPAASSAAQTPSSQSSPASSQSPQATSPAQPDKPAAPKSWANIVGDAHAGLSVPVQTPPTGGSSRPGQKAAPPPARVNGYVSRKVVSVEDDVTAPLLGEALLKHVPAAASACLQPRGLYNNRNWCYVNASLQALLATPGLHDTLSALQVALDAGRNTTSTPVLDAMVELASEFTELPEVAEVPVSKDAQKENVKRRPELKIGNPFRPDVIYRMLDNVEGSARFTLGRQEDAEEFLSVVLNALHEEMLGVMKVARDGAAPEPEVNGAPPEEDEDGDDMWEQVGPKNKCTVTRAATLESSPVSRLFGGNIRSVVQSLGQKESANLQPFFTLQLDIQAAEVTSVKQALQSMAVKENLEGYTCSKTKLEVDATRRMTLEDLPQVLILHIKWFVYNKEGGVMKIKDKRIDFDTELDISKELLSHSARQRYNASQRKYKLFAVITHHGQKALSGGHYTVDVHYPARAAHARSQAPRSLTTPSDMWVRFDDARITMTTTANVLKYQSPRVPYLLFYQRVTER